MKTVNLGDARTHLGELIERAASRDPVYITRRGKPVARIMTVEMPRKHVDVAALRAMTDTMPLQRESARGPVRRMRDEERY